MPIPLTTRAHDLLALARNEAKRRRQAYIGTEHLLWALIAIRHRALMSAFTNHGMDRHLVTATLDACIDAASDTVTVMPSTLSYNAERVLFHASQNAASAGNVELDTIVAALMEVSGGLAAEALSKLGISAGDVLLHLNFPSTGDRPIGGERLQGSVIARPTPTAFDMLNVTRRACADQAAQVVGRDAEIERLMQFLALRGRHNMLIAGPVGIGKRAIVDEVARRLDDSPPRNSRSSLILQLDLSRIIGSQHLFLSYEHHIKLAIKRAASPHSRELAIVLEHFDSLARIDGLAELLRQAPKAQPVRFIGLGTRSDPASIAEARAALGVSSEFLAVGSLTADTTRAIVEARCEHHRKYDNVFVSSKAIARILEAALSAPHRIASPGFPLLVLEQAVIAARRVLPSQVISSEGAFQLGEALIHSLSFGDAEPREQDGRSVRRRQRTPLLELAAESIDLAITRASATRQCARQRRANS